MNGIGTGENYEGKVTNTRMHKYADGDHTEKKILSVKDRIGKNEGGYSSIRLKKRFLRRRLYLGVRPVINYRDSFAKSSSKAQSAMEYLMTYGWAILIIAVVLGALFGLGVFNPYTFAAKASPGACQVFRPSGPSTTSFINLEGVCNGELPEYAASLGKSPAYITLSSPSGNLVGTSDINASRSITLWFISPTGAYGTIFTWSKNLDICGPFNLGGGDGASLFMHLCYNDFITSISYNPKVWNFVVVTWNNETCLLNVSIDGGAIYTQARTSGDCTFGNGGALTQGSINIGGWDDYWATLNGDVADVQIYNTTISPGEIKSLYQEGIGGAPIDLQNLVGWWPLNGNANDYSGNANNGQAYNVTFVSNWYNGYTPT